MTLSDAQVAKIRTLTHEAQQTLARRDRLVRSAREKGATWTEIGYALGITAQGAQKRYGDGPERVEAHKEAQAANALRRRQKAAKKTAAPSSADPWPDGTVQGTIG